MTILYMGKKIVSLKKLVSKKVRSKGPAVAAADQDRPSQEIDLLMGSDQDWDSCESSSPKTTTGFFPLYVGEDRQLFVVPTRYLSHPLFRMLLEKAQEEFGFEQRSGLVVPCSVTAFKEVLNAVQSCNKKFYFGELVVEFLRYKNLISD